VGLVSVCVWMTLAVLVAGLAPMKPGLFFHNIVSNRGKLLGQRTFSYFLGNIRKTGGSVRFVFGFSTGHVGTTTFASYGAYEADDIRNKRVFLLFERAGVPGGTYKKNTWTLEKEIQHVEYYYGPELMGNVTHKNSMVRVDMSHSNLFFYRGLLHVLTANNVSFSFVRIQRNRHELAVSMSTEHHRTCDFFSRDYFRYHPFEGEDRVILKIPGGNATWSQLTMQQKVLWVIDETEARWQWILANYPTIHHVVVKWSKLDDNIGDAVNKIAEVIGVRAVTGQLPHKKVHAGKKSGDTELLESISVQDQLYREKMKYDSPHSSSGEDFGYYLHTRNHNSTNAGAFFAAGKG
jgi:hypothetical protein